MILGAIAKLRKILLTLSRLSVCVSVRLYAQQTDVHEIAYSRMFKNFANKFNCH